MEDVRVVVVSDATKEYPNNKNNSFKVRLPIPLTLRGSGWEVAMYSASLPNTSHRHNPQLVSAQRVVEFNGAIFVSRQQDPDPSTATLWTGVFTKEDVLNSTSGRNMMRRLHHRISSKLQETIQNQSSFAFGDVKDNPGTQWEGEDFVLLHMSQSNSLWNHWLFYFRIDLEFARKIKWIIVLNDGTYLLNVEKLYFRLPKSANDQYRVLTVTDLSPVSSVPSVFKVSNGRLYLSRMVDWVFTNLDARFYEAIQRPSSTLLLYSDIVNSQVVGSQKAPLLSEIHCDRTKEGDMYFEPTHLQWVPYIQNHHVETIEMEIAENDGSSVVLGEGKTLVTLMFRQI